MVLNKVGNLLTEEYWLLFLGFLMAKIYDILLQKKLCILCLMVYIKYYNIRLLYYFRRAFYCNVSETTGQYTVLACSGVKVFTYFALVDLFQDISTWTLEHTNTRTLLSALRWYLGIVLLDKCSGNLIIWTSGSSTQVSWY